MSKFPGGDLSLEEKLSIAKDLQAEFAQGGTSRRGHNGGRQARVGVPRRRVPAYNSHAPRDPSAAPLFSPSPYTPRQGISSTFHGNGGFSRGAVKTATSSTVRAPTTSTTHTPLSDYTYIGCSSGFGARRPTTQPLSAPRGDILAVQAPAVRDQTNNITALSNTTNQPNQSKRVVSGDDGVESVKRARSGESPYSSADRTQHSVSSVVPTTKHTTNHGGLGSSRYADAPIRLQIINESTQQAAASTIHQQSPSSLRVHDEPSSQGLLGTSGASTAALSRNMEPPTPVKTTPTLGLADSQMGAQSTMPAAPTQQPLHNHKVSVSSDTEMSGISPAVVNPPVGGDPLENLRRRLGGLNVSRWADSPPTAPTPPTRSSKGRWVAAWVLERDRKLAEQQAQAQDEQQDDQPKSSYSTGPAFGRGG
ncbi:hypothetical protein BJ170DRAFT_682381 [Xylariales sp. AK1849]|nr:hypothetical protein BJ170DRAFT_682381 [Xylariales sp. AK1849]